MRIANVFALILVLSAFGCSNEERPSTPGVPITPYDARRDEDTSSDSGALDAALVDSASEIAPDAADPPDLGPPPDAAIFERCSSPYAAYGTKGLVAGGATPKAFADAYNAEVLTLTQPGPLLLAFKGVDSADSTKWKLRVGALDMATGSEVKFFGAPAEVTFKMTAGIALAVLDQAASFKLRFNAPSRTTLIPVDGIRFTGAAGDCSELSVDELALMIPESAGSQQFAGKTVGELMGAPIAPDGGPKFWILELLGSEKQVTVAGGAP